PALRRRRERRRDGLRHGRPRGPHAGPGSPRRPRPLGGRRPAHPQRVLPPRKRRRPPRHAGDAAMSASRPGGGLGALLRYFLGLGTWGFGGPIATVGYMQRDLVEQRGWINRDDFVDGVALGQTMPGPLAAQVTIGVG